jgi:ribosomal-protein-alanine N-acetyltransferase
MNAVAIRTASPDDAALLTQLHAHCFDEAWDEANFAAFLRDPYTFALIANDSQAFILVRAAADESEILSLGAHPVSRRSGLARTLIGAAGTEVYRRGARRMFLEVAADNEAALVLYGQAGFASVGRRPAYYIRAEGRTADAVILSAALPFLSGRFS